MTPLARQTRRGCFSLVLCCSAIARAMAFYSGQWWRNVKQDDLAMNHGDVMIKIAFSKPDFFLSEPSRSAFCEQPAGRRAKSRGACSSPCPAAGTVACRRRRALAAPTKDARCRCARPTIADLRPAHRSCDWCLGHRTPLDRRSAHGTWPLGGGGQRRARCGARIHRPRQHAHQPSATLVTYHRRAGAAPDLAPSPTAVHAATSPHRHPRVSMPRCEVHDLRGSSSSSRVGALAPAQSACRFAQNRHK